ncbi:universal stress protein [Sciscionella sediminilitoris]|uniref:universal stress protein n=1 Tax=Sciscionella sediminilitoris TaxID=1445613 RepID=UPI0004DF654C|nr:universal stress protein [Sciscionella sp. SE31]
MEAERRRRIVVGVDDGSDSALAVRWAAAHAAAVGLPLHCVYAEFNPYTMAAGDAGIPPALDLGMSRSDTDRVLSDAMRIASEVAPSLDIRAHAEPASPATLLLGEAKMSSLLVIGNHGAGVLSDLLLGSVCGTVAARSACPVVAVRSRRTELDQLAPVVVGADGSEVSERAIEWAHKFAAWHDKPLRVLHVCRRGRGDLDQARAYTEQLLDRCAHPGVPVSTEFVDGEPAEVLAGEAENAYLLVVGARGHGVASGLLTGSVSHALLRQAPCPVAVVRKQVVLQPV